MKTSTLLKTGLLLIALIFCLGACSKDYIVLPALSGDDLQQTEDEDDEIQQPEDEPEAEKEMEDDPEVTPEETPDPRGEPDPEFDSFVRTFEAVVFFNEDRGLIILEFDRFSAGDEYLSEDMFWADPNEGIGFQMNQLGLSGTYFQDEVEYHATMEGGLTIERINGDMTIQDEQGNSVELTRVDSEQADQIITDLEFRPLPKISRPEYLALFPDDRYLYVEDLKYSSSYDDYRAFLGTAGDMVEVEITEIIRYKDGGTTYVTTSEGTFYSPTPFKDDESSTFTTSEGETFDVEEFPVYEGENSDLLDSLGITLLEGEPVLPEL